MKKHLLPLLGIFVFLSACSSDDDQIFSNEQAMYTYGSEALDISNWDRAISLFQQLEAQYPFGQYAAQSQIELVYAYYRNGEPEAARAAADRYIRLHPDEDDIDYAYYMKGMSFYSEDSRILGRYTPTDPSKRDPGKARESFTDFSQLITRYPNSPYSADARARMIYLRNLLAAYEVHVAEFYIERQAFLSSLNRARYVVENYQGAPAVVRGLEIMIEMYLRLGLTDLADGSLAVLKKNYPDSPALNSKGDFIVSNQVTDPSFLYSMSFGLLGSNKRDANLAPVRRPGESDSNYAFQNEQASNRSLLNVVTFGALGEDGDTPLPTLPPEEEEE